jgi:hypothetical protein
VSFDSGAGPLAVVAGGSGGGAGVFALAALTGEVDTDRLVTRPLLEEGAGESGEVASVESVCWVDS